MSKLSARCCRQARATLRRRASVATARGRSYRRSRACEFALCDPRPSPTAEIGSAYLSDVASASFDRTLLLEVAPPNGSEAKLRHGPGCGRASGATLAATNDLSAGSVCKRRDAVTLGRKKGLQPRANERPADSFSFKLGRRSSTT